MRKRRKKIRKEVTHSRGFFTKSGECIDIQSSMKELKKGDIGNMCMAQGVHVLLLYLLTEG